MRHLAQSLAEMIDAIKLMGRLQWALRVVGFVAVAGALVLCQVAIPIPAALSIGLVLALVSCVRPDSIMPMITYGVVAAWALIGGVGLGLGAVIALLLGLSHLCAAQAGSLPDHVIGAPRAVRRLLVAGGGYLAVVAGLLAVAALVAGAALGTPLFAVVAIAAVVGSGVLMTRLL